MYSHARRISDRTARCIRSLIAILVGVVLDTVAGQWIKVQMMPRRPLFMDESECELVDQLKGLFTKDFSLRDVRYRTLCTPYAADLFNYNVNAEVLQPVNRH